jgi:hypothetical protein
VTRKNGISGYGIIDPWRGARSVQVLRRPPLGQLGVSLVHLQPLVT